MAVPFTEYYNLPFFASWDLEQVIFSYIIFLLYKLSVMQLKLICPVFSSCKILTVLRAIKPFTAPVPPGKGLLCFSKIFPFFFFLIPFSPRITC